MNQSEHRDTRRSKTKRAVDMSSMIEVVDPETMYQQRYVSVPLPDSAKAPQTATDPFRYLEEQLPSDKRRAFEKYKQSLLGSYRTSPESSSSNTTTTTPTSPKRTKQKYVYDAADDAVIDVLLRDRQCLSEGCFPCAVKQLGTQRCIYSRVHHLFFLKKRRTYSCHDAGEFESMA